MSQVINTNALSLVAQNNLNKSQSTLGTAIQRLSSGLRINSAKDDAAGQAISNRFTASISGLTQASRNANDGISIAQTTEGALNEVNDNLQNIRRLTVQAQNGTNSDSDRESIQDEINARLDEINRISDQTEFNGVKVLSSDQSLSIQVGANDSETIDIQLNRMDTKSLGMDDFTVEDNIKGAPLTQLHGGEHSLVHSTYKFDYTYDENKPFDLPQDIVQDRDTGTLYAVSNGDYFTIKQDNDGGLIFNSTPALAQTPDPAKLSSVLGKPYSFNCFIDGNIPNGKTLETDGDGNFYLDDGQGHLTSAAISFDIRGVARGFLETSFTDTGVAIANSHAHTSDPLKTIDAALAQVDKLRSGLGAVQNRFDSVISNLNNTVNNLSESRSRILDADFASEVSEMSRANILQSAGTSVLAQANQVPQNVLQLLR
ncbi:FliC/FljB family flagellin [Escherichia coli]|nr:FliC/FljB family flagellin [Escherichia coli]EIG1357896.1 FliC/FljB family flagellin [Escherichia coli]EIG1362024.1 FliC/FljB family flagellin [Escherichia coli]EIG1363709.1 FliC/FljB family flagellin [Escherichia coli]EIG2045282.1 FliC/FljB family flagellin [Escherichia coli]EJK2761346.1 FliC/FljB family flagellin [Escherichia coli]